MPDSCPAEDRSGNCVSRIHACRVGPQLLRFVRGRKILAQVPLHHLNFVNGTRQDVAGLRVTMDGVSTVSLSHCDAGPKKNIQ